MVPGVELDAGLGGQYFEGAPAFGGAEFCDSAEDTGGAAEDEIMIVAGAVGKLEILGGDIAADGFGQAEIEGGAGGVDQVAGGDRFGIDGGEFLGLDAEEVVEHGAGTGADFAIGIVSFEVEVAVVGEVDDGGLVRLGRIVDAQRAVVLEGVGDTDFKISWETFFAIGAGAGEDDAYALACFHGAALPDVFIETADAAVEGVFSVVGGEGVGLAIEGKLRVGDAVCVAAYGAAEEGVLLAGVAFDGIEAEHDVARDPVFIWDFDVGHGRAEIDEFDGGIIAVGERPLGDVSRAGNRAVGGAGNGHFGLAGVGDCEG